MFSLFFTPESVRRFEEQHKCERWSVEAVVNHLHIADTLDAYVARIRERSSLEIELFCDRDARLPLLQEREMWRIAQEALTNVERHAKATRARVLWRGGAPEDKALAEAARAGGLKF